VEKYSDRLIKLEENKSALFALITNGVSKITKSRLKEKLGYESAERASKVVWLLESLENIMVNFEDCKPRTRGMDDRLERIIKSKQGENTLNGDFLREMAKEIKVYVKYGGKFL